ncbi:hypothetical protein LAZ67_6002321 [Cordylochernes scorpioides]|uniref:HTH CENPB-type domain-containing protein n=1 Tax=Cordylochernes scorpioides TaxID=51811 RepID=A0ABY6KJP8_9ARAC|nr:hypothetical protein LAZ67_6002321 [Cordylochernes scorpioides]
MEADAFAADSNMSTDAAPPYPWSGTLAEVYQLGQLKSGFLKRSTPLLTMLLLVRDCLFVRVILLVSQLAFISEGRSPIRHLGTRPIAVSSAKGQEQPKTKIEILDRLRKGDRVVDVAKSYSMNEATIRTIRTNENTIRKSVAAGNTTIPIDTGAITNKALRIYEKIVEQLPSSSSTEKKPNILASHGWFERFKKRHYLHSLKLKGELGFWRRRCSPRISSKFCRNY